MWGTGQDVALAALVLEPVPAQLWAHTNLGTGGAWVLSQQQQLCKQQPRSTGVCWVSPSKTLPRPSGCGSEPWDLP